AEGSPFIAGHVLTRISRDGLSATNFALPGHILCCGQVDIRNYESNGNWYVAAHGHGPNFYLGMGWVNQFFGPGIFTGMLSSYVSVVRARAKRLQ
ncbi:MAG: hypothetical protein ACJ8ER_03995, partial [Allosphingosinicella sp.]